MEIKPSDMDILRDMADERSAYSRTLKALARAVLLLLKRGA